MKKLLLTLIACLGVITANAWTVYFTNPDNWEKPYVWAWIEDDQNGVDGGAIMGTSWPGKEMTKGQDDIWYYSQNNDNGVPNSIIISDNGSDTDRFQLGFTNFATYGKEGDSYKVVATAENVDYTVYAYNNTSWDNLYLYYFGDINNCAEWPGIKEPTSAMVNDVTYLAYTVSVPNGAIENLIFNNDGENIQIPDCSITFGDEQEIYLNVTLLGASVIEDPQTYTPEAGPQYKEFTIYVANNTEWEDVYIYMWGDGEFAGKWPGTAPETDTETIDGVDYLVFKVTMPEGAKENIIFNNNINEQFEGPVTNFTEDLTITISKGDAGYEYEVEEGDVEPEPEKEYYTIYVYNNTGWDDENVALYTYQTGKDGAIAWPGVKTETVETLYNTDYLVYNVTVVKDAEWNLIFSDNGANQLGTYTLVFTDDLYLAITSTGVTLIEDPSEFNSSELPEPDTYNVYVYNDAGWDNVYLYVWGDTTGMGAWPGSTNVSTETINDYEFLLFEMPAFEGDEENLIFNNGKGVQLGDLTLTLTDELDLYIEITAQKASLIENLSTFVPSGISSILNGAEGQLEFYNLQGVKVSNPQKGIYILKNGNETKKVVIK